MMLHTTKRFAGLVLASIGLLGFAASTAPIAFAQSTISTDGVIESKAGGFKFPDGTVQKTSAVSGGPYVLGGTGPAGGFVFHVTDGGLHGLEAAPVDQSSDAPWGCSGTDVVPAAANESLGTGASNTDDIIRGCTEAGTAAALSAEYVSPSGHYDWYLPSKDELRKMYTELHLNNLGGFVGDLYWSSSENNGNLAWNQLFLADLNGNNDKTITSRVRAVRAF